jgi:PilZ domain-containing protein
MDIECERRRTRRLAVTLPVCTTNTVLGNVTGATRDVSSSGAYFYIESDLWKEAASIELVLQLPSDIMLGDPMTAFCVGKMVRVEHLVGKMVGIAVEIESFTLRQVQAPG